MNNLISNSLVRKKTINRLEKLLIFPIGKLNLALKIDSVQKIIKYLPIQSSGLGSFGVIHVEEQEITVIDLYHLLFKESDPIAHSKEGHLILTRQLQGESFAILVAKPPSLIDVPLSEIRILPESYRRSDTLEIASHVTVISNGDDSLTIFILDVPIFWKILLRKISDSFNDESFLKSLHFLEKLVAKVLSLALVFVIFFSVVELFILLIEDLIKTSPNNFFQEDLLNILGLFLNVLIALEVLENLTVYLKKQTFLVELVVVTSLTAVARKIIIFDLKKYSSIDLIALSGSILALSISYWLLRRSNRSDDKK